MVDEANGQVAKKLSPMLNGYDKAEQDGVCLQDITRNDWISLAAIAERAERFDDMRYYMREATLFNPELNCDERNMLAVSYKSSMTSRRNSWRIIKKLEQRLSQSCSRSGSLPSESNPIANPGNPPSLDHLESTDSSDDSRKALNSPDLGEVEIKALAHFREAVKLEIESICYELIDLLRRHLLVHATETSNREAQVFYLKLIGDYYRYLTEMSPRDRESEVLEQANAYYNEALPLAYNCLKPADPCRLSLVLNLSVFLFEILNKPDQACQLAKRGYDAAISEVDGLPEKEQKEAKLIMDLLRENLGLWTSIDEND